MDPQFDGFSLQGTYGQTTTVSDLLDFKGKIYKGKLDQYKVPPKSFQHYLANYEYSQMEESDIESTFQAGKKLIVIGLNIDFLDQLDEAYFMYKNQNRITPTEKSPLDFINVWSPKNVQNLTLEATFTIGHEAISHAIRDLLGLEKLTLEMEHKLFNSIESNLSPGIQEIITNPNFRQTGAYKLYEDLNRAMIKNYTQPGTRHE
ncbi:MAG: hypothetical protein R3C61_28465 [Bacteroidia bacterium]